MIDGEKGFEKHRRLGKEHIRVRVKGYAYAGKLYDSVELANADRPSETVDNERVLLGDGPTEVLEDVANEG